MCCWGIWQHGRLGRPVPIIQTSTGRRRLFRGSAGGGDGKKTYARYQLRPLLVPGITNAVSVACGDAHTLCKTKEGYLLSWGQNSWYSSAYIDNCRMCCDAYMIAVGNWGLG